MSDFIAVDWGTTNRRAYRIKDGGVVATERDDHGVVAMAGRDYGSEVAAIRDRLGDVPMLLAGMVGSTIGWRAVPYVPVPAGVDALAAHVDRVDPRTAIVPGMSFDDGARVDVMRGEEVQLLGAAIGGLVPVDALLCQPGTHCKWARVRDGLVVDFTTAMTGEFFALLRGHSVLARQLTGNVTGGAAFAKGVGEGAKRDLGNALFGIRAAGVLGKLDDADAASYASGVLIGADVSARIAARRDVHVLGDRDLGGLYCAAVEVLGGTATLVDSHAAFVAGIVAIEEQSR